MYDRILLGIDFSEPSLSALDWTRENFPDAELILFNAVEPEPPPNYIRKALGDDIDLSGVATLDAKANLEQVAEQRSIEARLLVGQGWASDVITETAVAEDADLIVVGAHTPRRYPWTEVVDTAVRIVDRSTLPVLLWRPAVSGGDRTVLAAVDLREGSAPIAATAARVASHLGARLLLVHALPTRIHAFLKAANAPGKAEEAQRAIENAARADALERVPEELRSRLAVQAIVLSGRPMSAWILSTADNEAADLIVAGRSHAPGAPGRALLGGITADLVRDAIGSVLIVPV